MGAKVVCMSRAAFTGAEEIAAQVAADPALQPPAIKELMLAAARLIE